MLQLDRQPHRSDHTSKLYLRCKDTSHTKLCMETAAGDDPLLALGCGEKSCGEYVYPAVRVVEQMDNSPLITGNLYLNWTAHLPLGRTDWLLTAASLRPRLAELRANTGRFICLQLAPGLDLAEICCFDPNNCDCVSFQGLQDVSIFGGGHTDSAKRIFPPEGLTQPLQDRRSGRSEKCGSIARKHGIWRTQQFSTIYGPGNSNIIIRPCHSGGRCLIVDYFRGFQVRSQGKINPHWYQALDPESYNLTGDRDGIGIYWCRQQQCRNYYGRIPGFSRIVYSQEYSTRCARSCE